MFVVIYLILKRQPHKMVKYSQIVCRQQPTNCLSVFDHIMGLVLKRVKYLEKANISEYLKIL